MLDPAPLYAQISDSICTHTHTHLTHRDERTFQKPEGALAWLTCEGLGLEASYRVSPWTSVPVQVLRLLFLKKQIATGCEL